MEMPSVFETGRRAVTAELLAAILRYMPNGPEVFETAVGDMRRKLDKAGAERVPEFVAGMEAGIDAYRHLTGFHSETPGS